jgi:hypothetical protein
MTLGGKRSVALTLGPMRMPGMSPSVLLGFGGGVAVAPEAAVGLGVAASGPCGAVLGALAAGSGGGVCAGASDEAAGCDVVAGGLSSALA